MLPATSIASIAIALITSAILLCTTNACSFLTPYCTVRNGTNVTVQCPARPNHSTAEIILAGNVLNTTIADSRPYLVYYRASFLVNTELHNKTITCTEILNNGQEQHTARSTLLVEHAPVINGSCTFKRGNRSRFQIEWDIKSNPRVTLDDVHNIALNFSTTSDKLMYPVLKDVSDDTVKLEYHKPITGMSRFYAKLQVSNTIGTSTGIVVCCRRRKRHRC